ncbi:hypothetical protein [Streptomyces sp. LaPpAH-108]|uniref:hypothetical protein n=1 Tax=Streptomyces sp. LaPpAH-108 TaxID=1155714 RepID=UPI00036ED2E6|nr:hypothetical protein [Streptomyces sp. LaPpAH-108]
MQVGIAEARWLLEGGGPMDWVEWDRRVRVEGWYRPGDYGAGFRVLAVLESGSGEALGDEELAVALCHRDGRVRRRALERVVGRAALLPLVAVRCADWAEPVRERARELLVEALDAEAAVRLAPLVLRLADRQRGDFALGLLDQVLRREGPGPLLESGDRPARRFAYRLAVEEGLLPPAGLAWAAALDDDAVVQGLCADAALAATTDAEVVDVLLGARAPRVRAAGVTALRRLGRRERAEEFLADRSGLVRACARYVVRQLGGDPLPWYRARCAEPTPPPGAAVGLAECGERADAELLWPLLDHPEAGVRARAVAGLRVLGVTDVPRMRRLLDDPAPGVVGAATRALLPSAGALSAEWLLRRLDAERPRWERVSAWRLLDAHGKVARLRAAVALLEDGDVRLRARAEQVVRRATGWGTYWPGTYARSEPEVAGLLERGRLLLGALGRRQDTHA